MTFQAYLDNIKTKTGHSPEDFHALAIKAGVLKPDLKASEFVVWLKQDFGLGHGHAMALWNVFVTKGWVQPKQTKLKAAPKGK